MQCSVCKAVGIDGSVLACKCEPFTIKTAPVFKILTKPKAIPVQSKNNLKSKLILADEFPCAYRGGVVGQAVCNCEGKPRVFWCNELQGHCTVHSTGRTWSKLNNGTKRIGKLDPCVVCVKRRYPRCLLNKTIPEWHYITNSELADDVSDMVGNLPPIRGVAPMVVSGMSAGWMISTMLHVPHYEVSDQFGLRSSGHGGRGGSRHADESLPLLIIDDTVSSGGSISRIKEKLGKGNYIFGAVYCKPGAERHVDYFGTYLQEPHLLEWNLANTGYVQYLSPKAPACTFKGEGIAIDFDGVLCPDPPREFNEGDVRDRQAYMEWIKDASLLRFVPRMYEVPLIVSYRCEYTRPLTEAWLARHGIKYKELRMWPDAPGARDFSGRFKAEAYMEKDYGLFIESDEEQAKEIARISGKKVLCTDTKQVYG